MRAIAGRIGMFMALALGLGACTGVTVVQPLYYYHNFQIAPPRQNVISVCHGYSCRIQTPYEINGEDLARMKTFLGEQEQTPQGERAGVAMIVAYLETRIGASVGTASDRGRIELGGANDPSQQDCIDEASNTTSMLLVMQDNGLLKHHWVRKPQIRGYYINFQWPHWTAVLVENEAKSEWAIDSWFRPNGAQPVVIPLKDWYGYSERDGVREAI